jgi:hypothetical protein
LLAAGGSREPGQYLDQDAEREILRTIVEANIARKNLIIMENAPERGVRAPTIRRLLPVREILAPKQTPPESASIANNSDPFWALPMLADAYVAPTPSLFGRNAPFALGGCLIVAAVITVTSLLFFLSLSLLGIWGGNSSTPLDLAIVLSVSLRLATRVGVPLVLAAFLALTGLAVHKVWSVRSR